MKWQPNAVTVLVLSVHFVHRWVHKSLCYPKSLLFIIIQIVYITPRIFCLSFNQFDCLKMKKVTFNYAYCIPSVICIYISFIYRVTLHVGDTKFNVYHVQKCRKYLCEKQLLKFVVNTASFIYFVCSTEDINEMVSWIKQLTKKIDSMQANVAEEVPCSSPKSWMKTAIWWQ